MTRLWHRLVCHLWGHPRTEQWYRSWVRPAPGSRAWRRPVLTVCVRCGATLGTRTEVGR